MSNSSREAASTRGGPTPIKNNKHLYRLARHKQQRLDRLIRHIRYEIVIIDKHSYPEPARIIRVYTRLRHRIETSPHRGCVRIGNLSASVYETNIDKHRQTQCLQAFWATWSPMASNDRSPISNHKYAWRLFP